MLEREQELCPACGSENWGTEYYSEQFDCYMNVCECGNHFAGSRLH